MQILQLLIISRDFESRNFSLISGREDISNHNQDWADVSSEGLTNYDFHGKADYHRVAKLPGISAPPQLQSGSKQTSLRHFAAGLST